MGFDSSPNIQQVDPNAPAVNQTAGNIGDFLQGIFAGQNPFAGAASPLQQQAVGNISSFLGQQSPEQQTLQTVQPQLMELLGGQAIQNPYANQQLPQRGELQSMFPDLGAFNQGQNVIEAAQPAFQRNLQFARGDLSNQAPGRFGTAFESQDIDLTSRALDDFNRFQQGTLMQGLGLQQQAQQAAQNFALGARGLAQQADQLGVQQQGQNLDFLLGSQGLAQQGQLGAGGLLGQLAGQAGQAGFGRALQAGQFGAGLTQQQINPMLQLMLGGMQFGKPQGMDTIVSPNANAGLMSGLGGIGGTLLGSILGPAGGAVGGALGESLVGLLGGGGGGSKKIPTSKKP